MRSGERTERTQRTQTYSSAPIERPPNSGRGHIREAFSEAASRQFQDKPEMARVASVYQGSTKSGQAWT